MDVDSAALTILRRAERRLLATLMMSTALCFGMAPLILPAPQAAAQPARTHSFNIPSQPLTGALRSLASQTGMQIAYETSIAAGVTAPAVSGTMTTEQALRQLLSSSGLQYSFTSANAVTIVGAVVSHDRGGVAADGTMLLGTITVQGARPNSTIGNLPAPYAGGQVATGGQVGLLGNRTVMNAPFSQTNFTRRTIEDQQAQTVQEVLSNDPSVIASSQNNSSTDVQFIRGFQEYGRDGSRSLNGLAGMAPLLYPSTDYIERVEVLRGPSALVNGMSLASSGSIGGMVNLVTKQAGDEPLARLTARYLSDSQFGGHIDVGRRFGANNEIGIRFNGTLNGGNTSVDTQHSKFGVAALNIDYRGERVRLSVDFAHQSREISPSWNAIILGPALGRLSEVPRAPSSRTMISPSWAEERLTSTLGMVRAEADILDNVTAYAAIGAQTYEQQIRGVELPSLYDARGRYTLTPTIERYSRDVLSMQGGVRSTVTTGLVGHALSLDLSQAYWTYRQAVWSGSSSIIDSIYNPTFGPAPVLVDPGTPRPSNERHVSSIGIADTMSILDERIQLTAGLRYQRVRVTNFNTTTGLVSSTYDSQAWTPAVALVIKPWQNVSLYANYIEGLQPGTTVGSTYANAGETFAPYVSKQYEAGIKVDWGRVTTTLAVFQIGRPSTISIADPAGGRPTLALNGEQRNRGIELNAYGEVLEGVRLLAGATFLDARQTRTANGTLDDERGSSAPAVRLVIGGEWDTPFVKGLTLTGRFTYTSDQVIVNSRPDLTIPSWTQVDLGARYTFLSPWNVQPVTVRFNVDNVFDASYWKGAYANGVLYRGEPRTYRLSTTFRF